MSHGEPEAPTPRDDHPTDDPVHDDPVRENVDRLRHEDKKDRLTPNQDRDRWSEAGLPERTPEDVRQNDPGDPARPPA